MSFKRQPDSMLIYCYGLTKNTQNLFKDTANPSQLSTQGSLASPAVYPPQQRDPTNKQNKYKHCEQTFISDLQSLYLAEQVGRQRNALKLKKERVEKRLQCFSMVIYEIKILCTQVFLNLLKVITHFHINDNVYFFRIFFSSQIFLCSYVLDYNKHADIF